jgi:hypothetical protein
MTSMRWYSDFLSADHRSVTIDFALRLKNDYAPNVLSEDGSIKNHVIPETPDGYAAIEVGSFTSKTFNIEKMLRQTFQKTEVKFVE